MNEDLYNAGDAPIMRLQRISPRSFGITGVLDC